MRRTEKPRHRFSPRLFALEDRVTPATFNVTNSLDKAGETGTLREAIFAANTLSGTDTITFQAGLGNIVLTLGELAINEAVSIQGPGSSFLQINGNNASRIFNSSAAPAGEAIDISGLSLFSGKATGAGGAILGSGENLTLTDCFIAFSKSTGSGGGVATSGGSLALIRCQVATNQASSNGGGVDANGGAVISLTECTLSGNSATGNGGGLGIGSSSLTILNSTVSGNSADDGGGLYFAGTVGAGGLTVRNSTVSGNSGSGSGGGIALVNLTGSISVQNSTLAKNTAGSGNGGGIARLSGTGSLFLTSTVVATNTATSSSAEDLFTSGTATATSCALGTSKGVTILKANATTSDLLGQDFKLGALANNGGPTPTHLPASNSPILNLGSNPAPALLTDQHGAPFVRSFGAGVDIGAVEAQNGFVVTTTQDSGSGSLREAVSASNVNPGTDTITFDAALFATPQMITLSTGAIAISQSITINGTSAANVTISGNKASRIFEANEGSPSTIALFGLACVNGYGKNFVGGAIWLTNYTDLSLKACIFNDNSTASNGGAISFASGNLTIDGCTFAGNSAQLGGAIRSTAGILSMTNSTVSGNSANIGGGILHYHTGTISIRNSTVSGNTAVQIGGGLAFAGTTGVIQIRNSTITHNSAGKGGGLSPSFTTANIFVESSIVSGNTATNGPEIYNPGAVNTVASLFGSVSGITTFNADAGTLALVGQAALLGPLQDNGGPTFTHMPAFGSAAINQGINPAPTVPYDQRGVGYPRQRGPAIDIGAVEAMTLVVTNSNDAGAGSLRQAVTDANAAGGADTVLFDPTVFASPQTIKLSTGEIAISEAVTIAGPGASLVTVSGNNASRMFNTSSAPTLSAVTITGLTLSGGKAIFGGALYAFDENLTFTGCVLSGNTATASLGGAVLGVSSLGILVFDHCTLAGNQAVTGGAIAAASNLTMTNCTVSGNSSSSAIGGGGIYLTFATAIVRNTTISGNTATGGRGGGIVLQGTNVNVTLQNSTVTANSAGTTGGGLHRETGTLTIDSTVVAGNTAAGTGDDVQGAITANFSLLGISDDGPVVTGANNKTGSSATPLNPLLGPLQANGGPTLTRLPLPGSPLLSAGSNPAALATDQRGLPRTVGVTDIGAVEDQTPPPGVTGLIVNNGDVQRSRITTITVNFAALTDAAALGAITLTRTTALPGGIVGTVVNTGTGLIVSPASGMVMSVTLTFANVVTAGLDSASLGDGYWRLTIPAAGFLSPLDAPILRRLFGDIDANSTVDGAIDFPAFGNDFNSAGVSPFDFNNDGTVDGAIDFPAFGANFNRTL